MGQLIACASDAGIVVATDSRAEFFEPRGEERFITVDRLVPVTSHAVLVSAGAWQAQDVCRDFAAFAKGENLTDIEALIDAAIPFFTSRVDDILRKMCETIPPDPIINMYMLLAGYSSGSPNNPGHLFIIWDRPKPPKVEYNRVTNIYSLPRRMGLEFSLKQLVESKAPLSQVVGVTKSHMEKLAGMDESIGPPFHYVTITGKGIATV
jgi:hypothetical protein